MSAIKLISASEWAMRVCNIPFMCGAICVCVCVRPQYNVIIWTKRKMKWKEYTYIRINRQTVPFSDLYEMTANSEMSLLGTI